MATTSSGGEPAHATADREIVISRVIGAPRELVFEAFTQVRHLSRWWGPEGFTTTTRSFEFRVGGAWDFVMHGPDGTDYQEWITWREIVPPERIALLHGESRDDPNAFESVLTFEPAGERDPDRDAHGVPHQGTPRRGGGEVPRDRGRRADPAQPGGLRRRTHLERDHTEGSGGLMAGKVFFSVTMSLDGFMAPEAVPVEDVFSPERQDDPRVQRWMTKWSELQAWVFPQRWFRENLKLGEGGEEGLDNDIARATYERTGASVMGKRMFDAGELAWPEEAPFHTPVFVVTHTKRDPWERPGGTTFHFVNDGIESALDQAREAAGDRDVRIAGGAETIQEYLDSGLIDEFSITLAPVLFGTGIRLFDRVDPDRLALDQARTDASSRVTHLTYTVGKR